MSSDKMICTLFKCKMTGERKCCKFCLHLEDCDDPCLNDPNRCGRFRDRSKFKNGEAIKTLGVQLH